MKNSIGILGQEYYLPNTKKKVEDIFRDEDIPFGSLSKNVDFRKDIGIEEVHVTDELPSILALKAAQKVMSSTGISGAELDLIIDFTSIPQDYIGPTWSAAGLIQEKLNAHNAFSTAVTMGGCASYHFSMRAAVAMMSTEERINTVLLVAGDRTPDLNKTYYPITVASDGGSALILRNGWNRGTIIAVDTISIGRLHDVWYVPGVGHRQPEEPVTEKMLHMYCDMKRFNDGVIPLNFFMFDKIIKSVLLKAKLKKTDIDYYIYPTFSTWDQNYFCESQDIPREKVYTDALKLRGHVQESDMVINYVDAVDAGKIKQGDIVMVISNGAGFAWSAAVIRH